MADLALSRLTRRQFISATTAVAGASLPWPASSTTTASQPFDLLVLGGTVIDPAQGVAARRDVGIVAGRIARVAERIDGSEGRQVLDATGKYVTPGLIDSHVHVYAGVASPAIEADLVGVARGVTALVDGGSAGATTFEGFRMYVVRPARTRVYALLNIARPGMTVGNETSDLGFLDVDAAARTVRANRDVIVGIKVRMLAGIPDGQDLEVLRRTRAAADQAGVPIMIHIGVVHRLRRPPCMKREYDLGWDTVAGNEVGLANWCA